jgi:tetratricopeptide (TPR) repeat protein
VATSDNTGRKTALRPPAHFLGRDADLAAILGVLLSDAPVRAVLVQGAPGIGKTALTKAAASQPDVIEAFGEAHRWLVELKTATTAPLMQDAITRTLGTDPQMGFEATLAHLRRQPGLLVLDHLEIPWAPRTERRATEQTLAALATIPGLALLASLRGDDRVDGPHWWLIHRLERLKSPFDQELFCRIAQRNFDNDPCLPPFLAALEGVPLAIELVARRAFAGDSLAALWKQWTDIGSELAAHPDFDGGRLTSLPHSIELSLRSSRLTDAAFRLFRMLGQLPDGMAAEDKDKLLGSGGIDAEESLLRVGLAVERGDRLDLVSPIRDHAGRHHGPRAPDDRAWPAHYLDLACLGETLGTGGGEGPIARLEPEVANIAAAIRAVLSAGRRQDAMAALNGFGRLADLASLPAPVLMDLADACRTDGDILGEANCLMSVGDIALARSDCDAGRKAYEDALPLYGKAGDLLGEANCIKGLGNAALARSDHDRARKAYEDALPLFRKGGDLLGEATCMWSLGDIARARSDYDAARKAYEDALPLYRKIGDVPGEAVCIRRLADIALARHDVDTARKAYEDALPLYRDYGSVLGEAACIQSLGDIALRRSDYDGARKAYEKALSLYKKVGNLLGEANCIMCLGDAALARSDHGVARKAYEDALPPYRKIRQSARRGSVYRQTEEAPNDLNAH